jgi:hypothetical protein
MTSRDLLAGLLLSSSLYVAVGTVACSKPETAPAQPASSAPASSTAAPASQPVAAAPATPAAAPMGSGTAIASAQFGADPNLRCDLLEVKRTSGGALLVRWRLINTAGAQSTGLAAGGTPKPIYYNFDWQDLYYTDPAENKKYAFLTDSENNRILDVFWGNFSAGEQHLNWAKFPAPPPTSGKITVYIPKFMPFEDVPVSQ